MIAEFETRLRGTRLLFGWEASRKLREIVPTLGRRVLVVTSPGCSGQVDRIGHLVQAWESFGSVVQHWRGIRPNADLQDIEPAIPLARGSDVVVGIGGGSVLDSAKALSLLAASDVEVAEMLRSVRVADDAPRTPLVLVPTTAGTGSELSYGAILSDRRTGYKGGIRGARLAPDLAVVDPALTVTMPASRTAETGFDAFTHAVESLVSRSATPHSRILSLEAIALIGRHLPRALVEPDDRESRTALSYASCLMGLNLAGVGTCLPHRLQYPIGGCLPDLTHAGGLAWIYPVWIRHAFPHASDDLRLALSLLGAGAPATGDEASAMVTDWLEGIGVRVTPTARLDPDTLASRVIGNIAADPMPDPESRLAPIYREIFR